MRVLVLGASGATGSLLVRQLLDRGMYVRVLVRSQAHFLSLVQTHDHLDICVASLSEISDDILAEYMDACDAVVSCLGHNLSFKGIFWKPWRLVANATRRVCQIIQSKQNIHPIKFILMNSTGCRNEELHEKVSVAERFVVAVLRIIIQPHADNEQAAYYLRKKIGQDNAHIQWVCVRPDGLIDEDEVSEYSLHLSPIRSAIFDSGKSSRINVAYFMAELISQKDLWEHWKGKTPVLYNE